ncbi:protein on ecdysone puffs isoform X2 [Rhynchophorus ferrugineus]|uniref:protein on ecdysone puffs isoform X2 n=1 Tax=Rhynchophorus ferrugineus TaxID=354439 RepID=UPI003FCDA968
MTNRRMGGPRGGNRGFSQPFHSGGVNPWQGGSNNMNQGGIISQLTSTPQLALALTSLLQQQPQQQPPSLLSLNTSPAYSNSRDIGRFGNRGRDNRRHEPYNKNRGGWRSDKGRRRSPRRNDKKVDKKDAKKPEDSETAEDGADDEKESKRDWKDEKNTGDAKEESGDEAKKAQEKEGKFVGVPPKYLNCFVCNKQMWDGQSMGKHLRGRAHHEMIKALEESIHICVNILRENMRLSEERKMIELNRQNRLKRYGGKKHFVEPNSHCNMCDLKFMGKIVTHRRSEGHQRLKSYLHPTCRICEKEFPSRLEWIEHRLTPEHLKKLNEITEKNVGGKDGAEVVDVSAEIESEQDVDLEPLLEEPLQMESENPIMEIDDVLDGLQNRIPSYKQDRSVATKSLKPFTGFVCELCNRSFVDEQDSQDHLKSKRHYYKFVEALREQFERRERRRKEEEERKKKEEAEATAGSTADVSVKEEGADESKENGDQVDNEDEESEANGDQEMYDPEEHTEDNAEEAVKPEPVEVKAEAEVKEPEAKKPEPEVQPDVKEPVKEALVEPSTPAKGTPRKAAVRNGAGPKSKRARK